MSKRLGRWATGKVHGRRRSSEGYLLTSRHYLTDDQEWRLGQAYLGILAILLFVAVLAYLFEAYDHLPRRGGGRRIMLGHWRQMPAELRILVAVAVVSHLVALASMIRAILVWQEIGPQLRADLTDTDAG